MKYKLLNSKQIADAYDILINQINELTTTVVKNRFEKEEILNHIRAFYAHVIISNVTADFINKENLESIFDKKYATLKIKYDTEQIAKNKRESADEKISQEKIKKNIINFNLKSTRDFPKSSEYNNYDIIFTCMVELISTFKIMTYNVGNAAMGFISIEEIKDNTFKLNFEYSNRDEMKFSFTFEKTSDKQKFMESIMFLEIPKRYYTEDPGDVPGPVSDPKELTITEAIAVILRTIEKFIEAPKWGKIKKYSYE